MCEIEKQQGGGGSNRSRLKASPTFSHLGGGAGPHVQPLAIAQHGFLLTVGPGDEFITSQRKTTTTPVTKVHHTIAAVSSCEAANLVKQRCVLSCRLRCLLSRPKTNVFKPVLDESQWTIERLHIKLQNKIQSLIWHDFPQVSTVLMRSCSSKTIT